MKRYMAVSAKGGNSGIQTKEKAIKWASNQIGLMNGPDEVWICEVQEVVERAASPIHMRPFAAQEELSQAA